ncbi:MAG TPA: AI-2E family transporter, partial [Nitrospiria bacterium]|nr:AI-2E family transporter [Nitrospiria bacterium]
MNEETHFYRGTRILVIIAALVIIIRGVNQAHSVLVMFFVSIFLAVIGTPMVLWFEQKRIPSVVAVMTVMAGMITLMLMIGTVVGTSLNSFSSALPFYQTRLQEKVSVLQALLAKKGIGVTDQVLLDYVNPVKVMRLTAGMVGELGSMLSN